MLYHLYKIWFKSLKNSSKIAPSIFFSLEKNTLWTYDKFINYILVTDPKKD